MEIIKGRIYIDGVEKAPCLVSKARYALGLKGKRPGNKKTCSKEHWIELVREMGKFYKVSKDKIKAAETSRIYMS